MDTLDTFIQNFKNQFELLEDHEQVLPTTLFKELDSWDSLTAILVINMVEDEYGVSIDGDTMTTLDTVEDLYTYVRDSMSQ